MTPTLIAAATVAGLLIVALWYVTRLQRGVIDDLRAELEASDRATQSALDLYEKAVERGVGRYLALHTIAVATATTKNGTARRVHRMAMAALQGDME